MMGFDDRTGKKNPKMTALEREAEAFETALRSKKPKQKSIYKNNATDEEVANVFENMLRNK